MSGAILTLVTGTPGTGKTSLVVSMILDFLKHNPNRPVYAAGIKGLKIPHLKIPPRAEWAEPCPHPDDPTIDTFKYTFPPGSLVVIDEAHDFWPARPSGSKVPPYTAAMKTHRHFGIDFIIMTQQPGFLDHEIKGLLGRYIHLRNTFLGGQMLEWPEFANPASPTDRDRAARSRYSPPKKVFDLYTSSSMHVKNKRRIHPAFFLLAAIVACLALVVSYVVQSNVFSSPKVTSQPAPHHSVQQGEPRASAGTPAAPHSSMAASGPVMGVSVSDWIPRMPQRPETAPLYDTIRQVKSMPTIAGCVSSATRCKCYTVQGTDAFLTAEQCRAWIENPPFNPWRDPSLQNHQRDQGTGSVSRQDGPYPVGAAPPTGAGVS